MTRHRPALALLATTAALAGCGGGSSPTVTSAPATTTAAAPGKSATKRPALPKPGSPASFRVSRGTIPPQLAPGDVYAAAGANMLAPAVAKDKPRIYVPNSKSDTVDVIDPKTAKIVDHFDVGALPQHVTPSWDMRTLWVDNDRGNSLTPIDPRTGTHGKPVPVDDPYNLYFTPSGKWAIVVAERLQRLDFRRPKSMKISKRLKVDCKGVDHMDFTASGTRALASCEFGGKMVEVDLEKRKVVKYVELKPGAMPQDVKLSPDGRTFYVADMASNGVWTIDAQKMRKTGFIRTGKGAHGLYASRDAKHLYITNRGEGTISVLSFKSGKRVDRWRLPAGASPDMGNVDASGRVLWLSGRYDAEVYAISTETGKLLHRIKVGKGPHGLAVWPQPGRYATGHTGITR